MDVVPFVRPELVTKTALDFLRRFGVTPEPSDGVLKPPGSFTFCVPDVPHIAPGGFLLLRTSHSVYLGQVDETALEFFYAPTGSQFSIDFLFMSYRTAQQPTVPQGFLRGSGHVLAEIQGEKVLLTFDRVACQGPVTLDIPLAQTVEEFFLAAYGGGSPLLLAGSLRNHMSPVSIRIFPDGLTRHTGVFGQSGSGKSYAIGVLIEQLHLLTDVDVVVLDPNADVMRLSEDVRPVGSVNHPSSRLVFTEEDEARIRKVHDERRARLVLISSEAYAGAKELRVRFSDLPLKEQASLLSLDPVQNAEEYNEFVLSLQQMEKASKTYELSDFELLLRQSGRMPAQSLANRIKNVGLSNLSCWGKPDGGAVPIVEILDEPRFKTVVIDLSGLQARAKAVTATVALEALWQRQIARKAAAAGEGKPVRATIVVVDEAHHLFPARAAEALDALSLDVGQRIAGEGRKYGLYFLVATQLPSKLHEHVLTQCGNIVLLKMLSQTDLEAIQSAYSFVSRQLVNSARSFGKGDGLLIGNIVPTPVAVHFEGKWLPEGGADPKVAWVEALPDADVAPPVPVAKPHQADVAGPGGVEG